MRTLALWFTLLGLMLLGMTGCTDTAPPPIQDSYGEKIGSVSLPNSCADAAGCDPGHRWRVCPPAYDG